MIENNELNNFTRMIFKKSQSDSIGGSIGGSINNSKNKQIYLTDRQKDVLDLIKQNPKISYRKMAEILDIAESAVKKHLNTLKNKNVIKRVGGTRGWWEVLI